ncbi:MAG: helix-turn-helix domain-containing protein, partial [Myxococcota bacterium]
MSDPKKGRLKSASIAERRYDPEATRQAILAAAQRIFVDKGVGATTMRDIAEAAGVTKSLIHHHFRSKDELWKAVKQASFEQYFTAMLRIIRAEDENANPLKEVLEFTFRFHHERP